MVYELPGLPGQIFIGPTTYCEAARERIRNRFRSRFTSKPVDEVRHRWYDDTDTFGRVYVAILGITEPALYSEISETTD